MRLPSPPCVASRVEVRALIMRRDQRSQMAEIADKEMATREHAVPRGWPKLPKPRWGPPHPSTGHWALHVQGILMHFAPGVGEFSHVMSWCHYATRRYKAILRGSCYLQATPLQATRRPNCEGGEF